MPGEAPDDLVMTMMDAPNVSLHDLLNQLPLGSYWALAAKGACYEFHDFLWEGTRAGQTLRVTLRNKKFDLELRDYLTQTQAAASPLTLNFSALNQQHFRPTPAILDGETMHDLPVIDGPAVI